jgi:hypothetical protein
VYYVEEILCKKERDMPETAWELMTTPLRGKEQTPYDVVCWIQKILVREINDPECDMDKDVIRLMFCQTKAKEFMTYIKGKMGAM